MIIAGKEYGTGSSRDWAAKGTRLLGVRPSSSRASSASTAPTWWAWACCRCSSRTAPTARALKLDGTERFDILGIARGLKPRSELTCRIHRADGVIDTVPLLCRIDTLDELEYFRHGGILQYVLRHMMKAA